MPAYTSDQGTLTAVGGKLPRVQIVNPGSQAPTTHDTASGTIKPGDLVELVSAAASKTFYTQGGRARTVLVTPDFAASGSVLGASRSQYGVAMKQVQVLDQDTVASLSTGPTEIVNADIVSGEFVRIVRPGDGATLATTVVKPNDAFKPGDLLFFNVGASLPSNMTGTGSWAITTNVGKALAQVVSFTAVGTNDGGLLYMRLLA